MRRSAALLALFAVSAARDLELECRVINFCCYHRVAQSYQCELYNKGDFELMQVNDTVTRVSASRSYLEQPKDLSRARVFVARDGQMSYFPRGIEKFLKSLVAIRITEMGLLEIHQSDLRPFGELTHLCLSDNKLQVIERDLFKFNEKLETVNFSYNPITHISPNVLSRLHNLNFVSFEKIKCRLKTTHASESGDVVKVVESIKQRECVDVSTLMNENADAHRELESENEEMRGTIRNLRGIIETLRGS